MKISAIVPVCNSESTIAKTIESLLNQDYKIDEIIVVDDGSSDKTPEIALKYPVKLIRKKRGGEASALNCGIKKASGDYLAIVEADVILPKNWISSLFAEFQYLEVYGAGAILEVANPENLIAKLSGYELEYRYRKIKEKFVRHITSANTLYRKEVFDKVGYYNESLVNACLDADLNGRLIKQGYKLVLRKDIKVKHFWKTDLLSYLKRQLAYSFYRPRLKELSLYPTDRSIIFQVSLTVLFFLSFFLWPVYNFFPYLTLIFFAAVLSIQIPMVSQMFQLKRDWDLFWLPFLIFLRNIVSLFGYISGFIYKIIRVKK